MTNKRYKHVGNCQCDFCHITDDEERQKAITEALTSSIQEHGLVVVGLNPSDKNPSFSYTIGLYDRVGFDLIVIGPTPKFSHRFLNCVHRDFKAGYQYQTNERIQRPWIKTPFMIYECLDDIEDFAVQAIQLYGKRTPWYQILLPDLQGKFPSDKGYDFEYMSNKQVLIGNEGAPMTTLPLHSYQPVPA